MSRIILDTENGTPIQYELDEKTLNVFCDGFGPTMIGFPLVKLTLFNQEIPSGVDDKNIKRKVVATLTVPTAAFLQIAENIKNAISESSENIANAIDSSKAIIFNK